MATDVQLFHQTGCRLVHRYRIYKDPLPHVSQRGSVIRKLCAFVNQAMAVARLTSLHLSFPSSGMTPRPDQLVTDLVTPSPRKSLRVSFASDVEVMVSTPFPLSWWKGPESPDLRPPCREFLLPSDQGEVSDHGPAVFTIAAPAYVLFSFADPFAAEEEFFMPQFLPLPAPSGFAPIGPPGSLPGPPISCHRISLQ